MKLKEFIVEAPVDDLIAQNQDKASTPYNQSKVGNFIGGTSQPTSAVGKALNTLNPTNVISKIGGVAGGLNNALKAGAQSGLGGVSVAYKGPAGQQTTATGDQHIDYVPGKVDATVVDYLTKAANKQPVKQATGNANIDSILKAAGLLK